MLLDLWREACRHTDLAESLPRLAALLARRVPADLVLVRHLEPGADAAVETVAVTSPGGRPVPRASRADLSAALAEAAEAWVEAGAPSRLRDAAAVRALVPSGVRGSPIRS